MDDRSLECDLVFVDDEPTGWYQIPCGPDASVIEKQYMIDGQHVSRDEFVARFGEDRT